MLRIGKVCRRLMVTLMLFNSLVMTARGQTASDEPAPTSSKVSSLGLTPAQASLLKTAIDARDYIAAEKLLLAEIDSDPHSPRAARLLAFAGSVYFLNRDYLNAAVAWKKSEAIAPLEPSLQFSLAMAYIRLAHPDWARKVLESLTAQNRNEPLLDRKSVVEGKSVDLGGRRIIKKKNKKSRGGESRNVHRAHCEGGRTQTATWD